MHSISTPVTINITSLTTRNIRIPSKVYRLLKRSINVDLKVSTLKTKVDCHENNTEDILDIPGSTAEKLCLPSRVKANIAVVKNRIFIGPVIGVFVSNGQVRKAKKQHPHFRLVEYSKANEKVKAILFFFN